MNDYDVPTSDKRRITIEDVAAARVRLQHAIDTGTLNDATLSRLQNALEQLDNILLDASPGGIATSIAGDPADERQTSEGSEDPQVLGEDAACDGFTPQL